MQGGGGETHGTGNNVRSATGVQLCGRETRQWLHSFMTCDIKASSLKSLRPEVMAFFGASTKHDVFRSVGTFSSSRLGGVQY